MAKRRSNGEGRVEKLKSGTWRGTLMDGYTQEGKRKMISFTAPTKGEVQQKLRNYLAQKASAPEPEAKGNTFGEWADVWYADHRTQVQPSTYCGYGYTLDLLKKEFGNVALGDIRPVEINRFLNRLCEEGCSSSKISKCKAMLIQIFDSAESNELVKRNPARLAKVIRRMAETVPKKDAFSEEEVELMLMDLNDNLLGHSIRVMLGSGIRVQELLALTSDDIADDGSVIHINKAVKMVDGKPVLGTTKSKRGVRDVPIPEKYRASALYLKRHGGKAFVWCSGRGNLLYGVGTFRKWYYREIEKIPGVRCLPPHCCRHTYISRLQGRGVPMVEIARLVGHSNISTTDGYVHVSRNSLAEAVAVLNDVA